MKTSLFIIFLAFTIESFANIKKFNVDPKSEIEFIATGNPSMMTVEGQAKKLGGEISISEEGNITGFVDLDLNEFDTGIDLRTNHMKEKYLEIKKDDFKKVRFTIILANSKSSPFKFDGKLKFHGQEVELKNLTGSLIEKDKILTLNSKFKIKLSEYKIAIPNYAGITIEDEVELKIELNASLKE